MKKSYYIIIATCSSLLIIVFFLPTIFSTKSGTRFLLKKIEKKTHTSISIEEFNLSWFGPQKIKKIEYKDPNLDIQIDSIISNMSLFSFYKSLHSFKKFKFFANIDINNMNVQFHFPNLPKSSIYNLYASIKADIKGLNIINIKGKTKENNKIGNFESFLDFKFDKIYTKVIGTNIPTIAIDQIFFFNNKKYKNLLFGLLGPSFNVGINCILENLSGPINIDLNSTYSKAKLNLFYEKNKLTLKEDATVIIDFPGINPTFIENINYVKSIEPIIIRISKKDFLIPISPFKLEKLNIKNALVNLNKMAISNTGIIKTITNFAKMPFSQLISLWFTHVNLQISNKNLYFDRMDFLINEDIHLCIWGKVDLLDHNLRMFLGITSDVLLSVFGIQNLPSDFVIKIPIKGTLENPKIDASAATAKILALSTFKSKGIGSIIGGLMSKFQKDEDIPPPKKPYPWEGKIKSSKKLQQPIDLDNIFELFKK